MQCTLILPIHQQRTRFGKTVRTIGGMLRRRLVQVLRVQRRLRQAERVDEFSRPAP